MRVWVTYFQHNSMERKYLIHSTNSRNSDLFSRDLLVFVVFFLCVEFFFNVIQIFIGLCNSEEINRCYCERDSRNSIKLNVQCFILQYFVHQAKNRRGPFNDIYSCSSFFIRSVHLPVFFKHNTCQRKQYDVQAHIHICHIKGKTLSLPCSLISSHIYKSEQRIKQNSILMGTLERPTIINTNWIDRQRHCIICIIDKFTLSSLCSWRLSNCRTWRLSTFRTWRSSKFRTWIITVVY